MKKFTFLFVFAVIANLIMGSTAFGQVTQRGTATSGDYTGGTTLTISKPLLVTSGDLMIVNIAKFGNTAADPSLLGWTLVPGATGIIGDGIKGSLLYKVATGSEPTSYTFNLGTGASDATGSIVAFYNVDVSGSPFDVVGTMGLSLANGGTATAPGITTTLANSAVVMFAQQSDDKQFETPWSTTSPGTLSPLYVHEYNSPEISSTEDLSVGAAMAIKATAGPTGNGTVTLEDNNDRWGAILLALKYAPPPAPNLWSASGTGPIQSYTVDGVTGAITYGPTTVLGSPSTSTAALAKNQITGTDPFGCLYYLNRDDDNTLNGVVTVYSVKPDGTSNGSRGSIDMNGADNGDFSFVRFAFDALGRGWILAGSGSNIYIASFTGNGINAISGVNTYGATSLTVAAPGSATEFQNGDLAITAGGTLYAIANVTDGQTYIYTLNSLSTPTTLTRKWTVQTGGNTFSGSVNGLAWTQSGSLHLSTATGIYFIDQATANTVSGTVQASLVLSASGLTDLASDKFPSQSTLPIQLGTFTVTKQGNNAVLSWSTKTELNTDRFEIERSVDGINFATIGSKQAAGNSTTDIQYQYIDPITINSGIIYYRLKTLDIDAKSSYSKIVPLRLNGASVKDFTVYPNPFNNDLKVQINSTKETGVTVRISNAAGQTMVNRKAILQSGENVIVLSSELNNLSKGMYMLEVITEDNRLTQKIIKR